MNGLSEVLAKAKDDLQRINGKALSEEGFVRLDEYKQMFVNRKILPSDIAFDDHFPDDHAVRAYGDHVIQALWNIAHYLSEGYTKIITHHSQNIRNGLSVLGEFRVPKIIDDRTYQIGKLLEQFYINALTPVSLEIFPEFPNIRSRVKMSLEKAQQVLSHRLLVYEVHLSEQVQYTRTLLQLKQKYLNGLDDANQKYDKELAQFSLLIKDAKVFINDDLNCDVLQYELMLRRLQNKWERATQALSEFKVFNDNCYSQLQVQSIPDQIYVSKYIELLEQKEVQAQALVDEWSQIYNTVDYQVWSENIGLDLNERYLDTKNNIEQSKLKMLLMLTHNSEQLKIKQMDTELLAGYTQTIDNFLTQYAVPTVSESIQKVLDGTYQPLVEELHYYEQTITELENFYSLLFNYSDHVSAQLHQFELEHPLPQPNKPEHLPLFQEKLDKVKKILLSRFEKVSQLFHLVKQQIKMLHQTMMDLRDNLAKQSEQAREQLLMELKSQGNAAKQHYTLTSLPRLNDAKENLRHFMQQKYDPTIKSLKEKHTETTDVLNQLIAKLVSREEDLTQTLQRFEFLTLASSELIRYKAIIQNHPGIYLPAAKIHQDKLKEYLEINGPITEFIDELYEMEFKASNWFGVNYFNALNYLVHYGTILSPSEFDFNISSLIDLIDEKILSIKEELQRYQSINVELTTVFAAKNYYETLLEQANNEIQEKSVACLHQKMKYEQLVNQAQFDSAISLSAVDFSEISYCSYVIEFQLADLEQGQKKLHDLIERGINKGTEDPSDCFSEMLRRINDLETLTEESLIDGALSELSSKLLIIKETRAEIDLLQEQSTEHANSIKEQIEHFDETYKGWQLKLSRNTAAYAQVKQRIKENHEWVNNELEKQSILKNLDRINSESDRLVARFTDLNTPARATLLKDIKAFKYWVVPYVNEHQQYHDDQIQLKLSLISSKLPQLESTHQFLVLQSNQPLFKRQDIQYHYFGTHFGQIGQGGIFGAYLEERKATFWFKDLLRCYAAILLSVWGYQTDAQARKAYLQQLQEKISAYKEDEGMHDDLIVLINKGQHDFPPRARFGANYDASLHAKLELLKNDISAIGLSERSLMEATPHYSTTVPLG